MVAAVPAVLVSEKVGGVVSPEALVATEKAAAVWLAVKVDAEALPDAFVATRQVVNEPLLPPEQLAKVPEAPDAGAVKVTTMFGTGLPKLSTMFTPSAVEKAPPTVALWLLPAVIVIVSLVVAAVFVSEKLTGLGVVPAEVAATL